MSEEIFTTKSGRTVLIEVDGCIVNVYKHPEGGFVGSMTFQEVGDDRFISNLYLLHMDLSSYKGEGIGRRCLQMIIEETGLSIAAADRDGHRQDDGSHLIDDGPGFVEKMRKEGLIGPGSDQWDADENN